MKESYKEACKQWLALADIGECACPAAVADQEISWDGFSQDICSVWFIVEGCHMPTPSDRRCPCSEYTLEEVQAEVKRRLALEQA